MATDLSLTKLKNLISQYVTEKDPTLDITKLKEFVAFLQSEEIEVLKVVTELLGDLLRNQENRKQLGSLEGFVPTVTKLLQHSNEDIRYFSYRIIGNLCFNHDENRSRVLEAGAVELMCNEFLSTTNPKMLRVLCGCIANVVSTHENASEAVGKAGVIPKLVQLAKESSDFQSLAIRALQNLADSSEKNRELIEKENGLEILIQLLKQSNDDDFKAECVGAISALLATRTICFRFVEEFNGLVLLMQLMKETKDDDLNTDIAQILVDLSDKEDFRDAFFHKGIVHDLLTVIKASTNLMLRQHITKAYSNLSLSDKCVNVMFEDLDYIMKLFDDEDREIQICAAMILGNLARNDKRNAIMVEKGVPQMLINCIKDKFREIRVRHLAVGALRNISILPQNKLLLLKMGIMPPLIELLRNPNGIVQYAVIGCIKSLLSAGEQPIKMFVEIGGIEPMTELSKIDQNDHIKYESSRVLALVAASSPIYGSLVLKQEGGGQAIVKLLTSKFPILHVEAINALKTLIEVESNRPLVAKESNLIYALLTLIDSSSDDNIKIHSLEVLHVLANHPECATEIAAENGIAILKTALTNNQNNETFCSLVQKIIPLLPTNVPIKERKKEDTDKTTEAVVQSQATNTTSTTSSPTESQKTETNQTN